MTRRINCQSLAPVLVAALLLALLAPMSWATPVPSQASGPAAAAENRTVAAERDLIKGELMDFGLSEKQAAERLALLTDAEVHALAVDPESLRAAGATENWDTLTVILLAILVAVIVSD